MEEAKLNPNKHLTLDEGQDGTTPGLGSAATPSPRERERHRLSAGRGVRGDAGWVPGSTFLPGKGSPVCQHCGSSCGVVLGVSAFRGLQVLCRFLRAACPCLPSVTGLPLNLTGNVVLVRLLVVEWLVLWGGVGGLLPFLALCMTLLSSS